MDNFRYRTAGVCCRRGMGSEQELKGMDMNKRNVVKRVDPLGAYVGVMVFGVSFTATVVNLFGAVAGWWPATLWGYPFLGMLLGIVILVIWLVNSTGYNHEA